MWGITKSINLSAKIVDIDPIQKTIQQIPDKNYKIWSNYEKKFATLAQIGAMYRNLTISFACDVTRK